MEGLYPKAVWLGNGQSGGTYTGGPWKIVLHTTETKTLPGYEDGATAPHMTYHCAERKFYQHTTFLTAARSLVNGPHPVQTNRDQALQLEIVCYSAKSIAESVGGLWVGDLTGEHLADIRGWIDWCHTEFGVQLKARGKNARSWSEANQPGFRFTTAEWDNWDGVCAHHDVPDENTHWDTGELDWTALMGEEETMYPINVGDGTKNQRPSKAEDVKHVQQKMKLLGHNVAVDGSANQAFLNRVFEEVGSPAGGTFISGVEGAILDQHLIEKFAVPGPKGAKGDPGPKGAKGDDGVAAVTVNGAQVFP